MKIFFILLLLIASIQTPVRAETNINTETVKRPFLLLNKDFPRVYKPTKLIIGKENKFIVKAAPGSFVTLAFSGSNTGISLPNGQTLRLSSGFKAVEGTVPANGLLELNFVLPYNKELNEKNLYFEAIISKDDNFTDAGVAKIIAPSGMETENNSIIINLPPDDGRKPSLIPAVPGMPGEMIRAIGEIGKNSSEKNREDQENLEYNGYYYRNPVIIRNLNSPDVNSEQEKDK